MSPFTCLGEFCIDWTSGNLQMCHQATPWACRCQAQPAAVAAVKVGRHWRSHMEPDKRPPEQGALCRGSLALLQVAKIKKALALVPKAGSQAGAVGNLSSGARSPPAGWTSRRRGGGARRDGLQELGANVWPCRVSCCFL